MATSESDDGLSYNYEARKKLKRRASRIRYNERIKVKNLNRTSFNEETSSSISSQECNLPSNSADIDVKNSMSKDANANSSSSNTSKNHKGSEALYKKKIETKLLHDRISSSSSSSSISSDEDQLNEKTLWDDLKSTVVETQMNRNQVNRILADLRRHGVGPLPADHRTLTRQKNNFHIKSVSGMKYYYFGLLSQLRVALSHYPEAHLSTIDEITIADNIDGLPLFKSCSQSFWPILGKIINLSPSKVFCIALTFGAGKPNDLEFLREYVEEINKLALEGFVFNGNSFKFNVSAHICDAPARSMVKETKSFHAYYGCDFCETKADYDGKRMTWLKTVGLVERTDHSFRNRTQEEHHKSHSPFELTSCNMIDSFPIDFMHQGTGVILKLIKWNILSPGRDERKRTCRMSASNIKIMNSRLMALRKCVPNCFARRPRSTTDLLRFKATELRQILLYTSRLIFKGLMASDDHYIHVCTLSMACCLLVDSRTVHSESERARNLLISFCDQAKKLYGKSFMVYNVHCLLHLERVARVHGSLDSVSAYAFENFLGSLKRSIRSPRNPIVSAVKYVYEMQEASSIRKHQTKIYSTYPNNCYVDIARRLCFEVVEIQSGSIFVRQYHGTSYLSRPCPTDIIGCLSVKLNQFTYVSMDPGLLASKRRAMKVDLNFMEGLQQPNTAVFISMLHHESESLF